MTCAYYYRKDHIVKVKIGSPADRANITVGLAVVGVNHRNTIGLEGQVGANVSFANTVTQHNLHYSRRQRNNGPVSL